MVTAARNRPPPRAESAPPRVDSASPMGAPDVPSGHGKSNVFVLAVVVSYGLSSLGGVFVNKACLSAFDFRYTITLMLCQLLVSVSALSILRVFKVVSIPRRTWSELSVLLFPAMFFIGNVTIGLLALRLVNIPMFSAFRRLSVLNVMALEWWVLGKTAHRRILLTVLAMVFGSFMAGLGDLTFNAIGYCLVFLNNFITGANLVSIKKATSIVRLDALSMFYYVSSISLPIVFMLALVTGELRLAFDAISTRPDLRSPAFMFALSLSAGSAFLINFFTNLCTQLTSPLTTAITGQMKNVLQTVLGIFAFGYKLTLLNFVGLCIALAGSLQFAYYKYDDARVLREAQRINDRSISSTSSTATETDAPEGSVQIDLEKAMLLRAAVRHTPVPLSSKLEGKNEV